MLLFMGMFYKELSVFFIGLSIVIINIWCIRTQFLIDETQYKLGMIPHHSMAVHMSKKLIEKEKQKEKQKENKTTIRPFLQNLIKTQENEILILKK